MCRQSEKPVKQQYHLHMFSQCRELRPLTAEICWRVWGTPANFNGFRVLASLLHRRCSTEVNQTLHDVWPFPGYTIYRPIVFFWGGGLLPLNGVLLRTFFSLCVQVLRSPILAALLHDTRAVVVSKLSDVAQLIELRNFRSLSFSTQGATYVR